MNHLLELTTLTIFAVGWIILGKKWERHHRRKRLRNRTRIDVETLMRQRYSEDDIPLLVELWVGISDTLGVDPGLLRPEDRLNELKGVPVTLETDIDDLEHWTLLKTKPDSPDPEDDLATLEDVLRYTFQNYQHPGTDKRRTPPRII